MIKNTVTTDRSPQIEKLRLDTRVATTNAQQSGVAMADIVLVLLQRANELCATSPPSRVRT
jgi:hypothetical protein